MSHYKPSIKVTHYREREKPIEKVSREIETTDRTGDRRVLMSLPRVDWLRPKGATPPPT